MSTDVGDRMNDAICRFFDGQDLPAKEDAAFLLLTSDLDGTPRPCMVSVGEVLATSASELRFALWSGSNTAQNLSRGSRALFCFVTDADLAYVYGTPRELSSTDATTNLEYFAVDVDRISSDVHHGMPVTSGIRFNLAGRNRTEVLSEWQRQINLLRDAE